VNLLVTVLLRLTLTCNSFTCRRVCCCLQLGSIPAAVWCPGSSKQCLYWQTEVILLLLLV